MSNEYETRCNGIMRSAQFGWNEYEGVRQPQLVARFELIDGDDAGKFDTWFGSLSEDENSKGIQFYEYTIKSLRACGWTGDDLSEIPDLAENGSLAKEVSLVRTHKVLDTGETKTKIKYVGGGGGAKIDLKENAMTEREVADFARRMRSRIGGKAAGGSSGTQRSAAPPTRNAAPPARNGGQRHPNAPGNRDDSDIPFVVCDLDAEPSAVAAVLRGEP